MFRQLTLLTLFIFFGYYSIKAQEKDTLSLTLLQADSLFVKNSFTLLASQYNIEQQKALEVQARLYPNPIFTADVNAYDPQNKKEFHVGSTGQKAFNLEQLILLGGKRSASIQLAKQNTQLAQLEFESLQNSLKLQLHISFYTLQQQTALLEKYTQQLTMLDTMITAYEVQAQRGNIPLKDVVRLKSAYLRINNDKSELAAQHAEEIKKMQVLLQLPVYIKPAIDNSFYGRFQQEPQLQQLLSQALNNRPETKIADVEILQAATNLRFQKAQAVPDINLFTSYDQRGGAFNNQINAGLSIPLPFWNRNQGNIKAARWQKKSAEIAQQQTTVEISAEVREAYTNMLRSITEYKKTNSYFTEDFEAVAQGVTDNFRKRNISIIEFVDFFEAYNESVAETQRVNIQLATGAELINYVTASPIYKYE